MAPPFKKPAQPIGLRLAEWGQYLYVPEDLEERIKSTPWQVWRGRRLLMSSAHDPYLPELYSPGKWPRKIPEAALPHGVKFAILTRSTLPVVDFDLYAKYRGQIMLMSSIPTLDGNFTRITEPPGAASRGPARHAQKGQEAGRRGRRRGGAHDNAAWLGEDLEWLFKALTELRPAVVYSESLHICGLTRRAEGGRCGGGCGPRRRQRGGQALRGASKARAEGNLLV